MRNFLLLVVMVATICLASGCAGAGIPRQEYSELETPQELFDFAKKSIAENDPAAFYHCFSQRLQQAVSLSDLKLGWGLAGRYFGIFLQAKLADVASPAPDFPGYDHTAKMTVRSNSVDASFLLIREKGKWKVASVNHYPLPDIAQLQLEPLFPWRNKRDYSVLRDRQDWHDKEKIVRKIEEQPEKKRRKPFWRSDPYWLHYALDRYPFPYPEHTFGTESKRALVK